MILRLSIAAAIAAFVAVVILAGPAPVGTIADGTEGREIRAAAGPAQCGIGAVASPGTSGQELPEPAAAPSPARTRGTVIKEILPSNVRIAVQADGQQLRSASGVIFAVEQGLAAPTSYVLTNAHVVAAEGDRTTFEVLVDQKQRTTRFPATVIATGKVPDPDIAVLKVPGLAGTPVTMAADADLEVGDEVLAIGAPFGRGLSVSSGIVSQLEWEKEEDEGPLKFKTDAPIGYGASGGGIFRVPDGKLLALVEGYRTAKVSFPVAKSSYSFDVPMPGETFAAPVAKIRRFLHENDLGRLLAPPKAATACSPALSGHVTAD